MHLLISHQSVYNYSEPVFLEPQYLSFHPQDRPYLSTRKFMMKILPEPKGQHAVLDLENNHRHQCWFSETVDQLKVEVQMEVESSEFNPFSFFIDQGLATDQRLNDFPYLKLHQPLTGKMTELIEDFKGKILEDPLGPINYLLQYIRENYDHEARYEEHIHSPSECFELKNASCRDLSWMLIHMLRWLGLPSRFVSGYAFNPELGEGHELHAWVECLVPGAGWLGLDPSAGVYTDNKYIPVSCSYEPRYAMPINGYFRGKASSNLTTKVDIQSI
jgi:transglutaminase-like putative cysteine protease